MHNKCTLEIWPNNLLNLFITKKFFKNGCMKIHNLDYKIYKKELLLI